MKFEKVNINGLLLIEPNIFDDNRGYFYESFNNEKYHIITENFSFVQDNISKSKYGTIRGLHYQIGEYAQGKLISVLIGKVLDVAVDIRFGSPTFGKYFGIELSEENKKQLWIPPGFAHGFSVLSESATVFYKCDNLYAPEMERSIDVFDEKLKIDWKINNSDALVSEKDRTNPKFLNAEHNF
jgi:dTDP-4-dehydrorhamnose 3,5-epimerase